MKDVDFGSNIINMGLSKELLSSSWKEVGHVYSSSGPKANCRAVKTVHQILGIWWLFIKVHVVGESKETPNIHAAYNCSHFGVEWSFYSELGGRKYIETRPPHYLSLMLLGLSGIIAFISVFRRCIYFLMIHKHSCLAFRLLRSWKRTRIIHGSEGNMRRSLCPGLL